MGLISIYSQFYIEHTCFIIMLGHNTLKQHYKKVAAIIMLGHNIYFATTLQKGRSDYAILYGRYAEEGGRDHVIATN